MTGWGTWRRLTGSSRTTRSASSSPATRCAWTPETSPAWRRCSSTTSGSGGTGPVAAELAAFFEDAVRDVGVTILNVGTHLIELDDADHARGVVYCRAELQLGDRWVVQAIQYRDVYERRDGAWCFVRRTHLLWYGRDVGTSPLGLPPADWPEHDTGWGEPEAWPPWSARRP